MESFIDNKELSSVMKDIVSVNHTKKFQSNFTSDKFVWKLENGEKVLLWEDIWLQDKPRKDMFPRLYKILKWKHLEVSSFLDLWECYDLYSEDFWKRILRSWEIKKVNDMVKLLCNVKLTNKADLLNWTPARWLLCQMSYKLSKE